MIGTLAYLSTPYTFYRDGHECAAAEATRLASHLIAAGVCVYSPIAYAHNLAITGRLDPRDMAIWMPLEEVMCDVSRVLIVGRLDGWDRSEGIGRELARFERAKKPIYDLDPMTLRMTRRPDAGVVPIAALAHGKHPRHQGGSSQ